MAVNSQAATFDDMYGFLKFKRFPSPYSKNQKDVLRRRSKKFKIGDDDTLYFNSDGKELIVVRNSSLYHKIFEECHSTETGAHLGRDKTMSRVRERYYWPHMAIFIAQKVSVLHEFSSFICKFYIDFFQIFLRKKYQSFRYHVPLSCLMILDIQCV